MLASESGALSGRNKENQPSLAHYETLKSIIGRNEQALLEIRRELKQKVNRSDFLTSISSKISLSDLNNLTLNNLSDIHPQETTRQVIKEEVEREFAQRTTAIQASSKNQLQSINKVIQQLSVRVAKLESTQGSHEWVRELREADLKLVERVEAKAERSELDKIMHLSSLLAIEFQLIKKRFGNFEVDYNLIWKEISALYSQQDSLRSVFQTQRKESAENTCQKQLQALLKTSKNPDIVGKLFPEKQEVAAFDREQEIQQVYQEKASQKLECIELVQRDQEFTIKSLSERLMTIEQDFDNQSQLLREIKQLKKEYGNAKEELVYLQRKHRELHVQVEKEVDEQCQRGLKQLGYSIGQEIREACEEISVKMMQLFDQCAKSTEIAAFTNNLDGIQQILTEKIETVNECLRKGLNSVGIRVELHQDKLRLMGKDLANRLKIEDFDQIRQVYMTMDASQALVRKAETHLKKELSDFKENQKTINEVMCSETILARWIWISGELKCGNLVGWDRESVNTLPDNFIMLRGEGAFRIVSSGIYRIEMGFYGKKKPSIQIIVNGKTIVSAVNNSSYVLHHSSGKLKDICNSQVVGLTYYDFLTLQENTRLAIAYSGDAGHGFLGIQRL